MCVRYERVGWWSIQRGDAATIAFEMVWVDAKMFTKVQTLEVMFRNITKMFRDIRICSCMFRHLG
jgi:hypothetical protein